MTGNAGLYWLARLIEGGADPLFIARRLCILASEDIGLADPQAMVQAAAAAGWLEGDAVATEHVTAIRRAGADMVLTYFARSLAERLAR